VRIINPKGNYFKKGKRITKRHLWHTNKRYLKPKKIITKKKRKLLEI